MQDLLSIFVLRINSETQHFITQGSQITYEVDSLIIISSFWN